MILKMTCPSCGSLTEIAASKTRANYYYRRRRCSGCGYNFSTTAPTKRSPEAIYSPAASGYRPGPRPGTMQREPFEKWLTRDLPIAVHLGRLRRAFEAGLSREEAIRRAM